MDLSSWGLGLSLIVLTIAIHTTAVVLMAFGLETRIRVRVDRRKPDLLRAILTVIGHIGAVALILAALHGLEGVLWASAYWWLGALDSFTDASRLCPGHHDHVRNTGINVAVPVPDVKRPTSGERCAAVRHQHGVPFRCHTGPLAGGLPPTRTVE